MRRMEKITGRTDDMIILRGVNLFPTQIEELILRHAGAVAALPVRADAATGRLDELTVRVERRADAVAGDGGARPAPSSARLVKATDRRHASRSTSSSPDGIERSVGKMRRIVDERAR